MPLAHWNHEIEALAPDGADQSFAQAIGHRTTIGCLQHAQTEILNRLVEGRREDAVAVVHQIPIWVFEREGFSKLLQRPLRAGMASDVEVKHAPGSMLHHDEDVAQLKGRRHRDEEVAGYDCVSVIAQERGPTLIASRRPSWSRHHVFAYSTRRDPDPEFDEQLVGDAFLSPGWILTGHQSHKCPKFMWDRRTPRA